eukprot:507127-Hanusia_phi.AAC.1
MLAVALRCGGDGLDSLARACWRPGKDGLCSLASCQQDCMTPYSSGEHTAGFGSRAPCTTFCATTSSSLIAQKGTW